MRKSTRRAPSMRGGRSRGEAPSGIRLELTLTGSTAWKLLRLLLVLASVGSSPFVFRRSMEVLWATGAATAPTPGASTEGAQRNHLESGR
ncbi:hypothetical protein NR798_47645 [Archangium gephyra]|uniref:hypothetical protein n=1 Tax=Archangium gephyra TaxID=48 RepID=UPI0035D4D0EC